ncbi:MAG: phosphatase PAP2 family protein [Actinobacteria bacterium]|nr:phosphatase PAP2 family protein [Actinomycetota bacterium]
MSGTDGGRVARIKRSGSEVVRELETLDQNVYAAIAATDTPSLDRSLAHLSNAANKSGIWFGTAAVLAIAGGAQGRRAGLAGLAAIGVASAVVNLGLKHVWRRRRPDPLGAGVPDRRHVHMPDSTSFPSGHSASAFAFATAVSLREPVLGVPLLGLAGAVAYSRVHTGVHYPGDVVVGSLVGVAAATLTAPVTDRILGR